MGTFFKRIFQILAVIFALIIAAFSVQVYSDKLSTHRVSLQCTWSDNSPNALEYLEWPENLIQHIQIREDWVNDTLIGYTIASGIEGGVQKYAMGETVNKYWYTEFEDTFKVTTEYNRETLKNRMTVVYSDGTTIWVEGPCEVIAPSAFQSEKTKAITQLKAKQKI